MYGKPFLMHAHFNFYSFKHCGNVILSLLKIAWKVRTIDRGMRKKYFIDLFIVTWRVI